MQIHVYHDDFRNYEKRHLVHSFIDIILLVILMTRNLPGADPGVCKGWHAIARYSAVADGCMSFTLKLYVLYF